MRGLPHISQAEYATRNVGVYRKDIDGLRALAVLSVILFHIESSLIPGGFIGVDVFFVISGYLITQQINSDLDLDRFSLIGFYERRIKRLMPALFAVILPTLVLAQHFLLPNDAMDVARSSIWSALSLANIYFYGFLDTGYFADASNTKPLLHLWSLGVEEQFYLFWPLLLICLFKINRPLISLSIVFLIGAASFVFAHLYYSSSSSFVYYMLPARMGEFLLGSIAALLVSKGVGRGLCTRWGGFISSIAMLVLAGSFALLTEDRVFPGFWALIPCGATALMLWSGAYRGSFVQGLLGYAPVVWIGLLSYSAYLWHWPILAFFRYAQLKMTPEFGALILLGTFFLAWITYTFVEQPYRSKSYDSRQLWGRIFVFPAVLVMLVSSLSILQLEGFGGRYFSDKYKSKVKRISTQTNSAKSYSFICQKRRLLQSDVRNKDCVVGHKKSVGNSVLLWGDSNAAHYVGMLHVFAKNEKYKFRNLSVSSCPPLLTDPKRFVGRKNYMDCSESLKLISPSIDNYSTIILAASWSNYVKRSDDFLATFFETVDSLVSNGKRVIILGRAPIFKDYDRKCKLKRVSLKFMDCDVKPQPLYRTITNVNKELEVYSQGVDGVEYFDANDTLCPNGWCSIFDANGRPLYYDSTHLAYFGARKLGNDIYRLTGVPEVFKKEKTSSKLVNN